MVQAQLALQGAGIVDLLDEIGERERLLVKDLEAHPAALGRPAEARAVRVSCTFAAGTRSERPFASSR